ncbi:hypothetical protein PGT21_029213 [Puccinia graminis f. sp. tritici]|uniref:Secreted protein n=1 Tax=Puccinia graminis f. sp. tritici TaxID=56615 RepID=A0A5B0S1T5_PUCGR|nr:hypothetical protein PGT21_029213 [Puccinia graminis f. sp. tritici]KAA1131255.1 hypothetical protein PGTUg99_027654 [Puccinia graminis f. sp. tritici]
MLSFNFFCHALPVISIIGPFVNAGFLPQEPVHFTRSSSVTESSTSSKTTSTKSFHSSVINQPAVVVRSFPLSQDGVNCQYQALPQGHQGIQSNSYAAGSAPSSRMVANLTPHNCHVRCTPPSPTSPNKHDCQKIINTMRNMKQRQITIEPRNWLYVSYRQCAVVFENPGAQNVAVVYQWNRLADQAERLQSQCAGGSSTSTPGYGSGSKSTGTCFFSSCDLNDSTHPFNASRKTNTNAKTSKVENSGVMITFQRNKYVQ